MSNKTRQQLIMFFLASTSFLSLYMISSFGQYLFRNLDRDGLTTPTYINIAVIIFFIVLGVTSLLELQRMRRNLK